MSIRNNLHTKAGLDTYANGMCNSSSDKAQINQYLCPGSILEIGCGNGAYLMTLPPGRMSQTTAVDMNAHLLHMAVQQLGNPGKVITFVRSNVLDDNFLTGSFDNIVMCSVLHELYSELRTAAMVGGKDYAEEQAQAGLRKVFRNVWALLKVGGHLIIRDGTRPPSDTVILRFKNPTVRATFARFVDDHPWFINYREASGCVFLSRPDLFEFLSKYFYTENWDVEVLERFGWASYSDIADNLELAVGKGAFQTIECKPYLIPWLKAKWEQDFELYEPDALQRRAQWPDSTLIAVFTKIS